MDQKNQFIPSLHRYWLQANRIREDFLQEANKRKESNVYNLYIYRDLWLASLHTVVVSYRSLELNDPDIVIDESLIYTLEFFRNITYHFEFPSKRDKKITRLSNLSLKEINDLHNLLGAYLIRELIIIQKNVGNDF
jgi:hypothetical protein